MILEVQNKGCNEPHVFLDVQAEDGGGSFAEAKMDVLRLGFASSSGGDVDVSWLKQYVDAEQDTTDAAHKIVIEQLSELTDRSQVSDLLMGMVRDSFGVCLYHGGVSVPYTAGLDTLGAQIHSEVRVSFSGASEV